MDLGDVVLSAAPGRTITGALLASAIAAAAWKARALSASGAFAAVMLGAACAAAGWTWAAMLILFFLSSTGLGRIGKEHRARRTGGIVAKGGARDGWQVLANGGVFAGAALGSLAYPAPGWLALGGGALSAAAADTWATEVGSLAPGSPRDILRWRLVPPGTSGAISARGSIASMAGAMFIAGIAAAGGWPGRVAIAIVVGGVAGALADSLLGATVQVRRWCDRCDSGTEQDVHRCGARTRISGGVRWIDNDLVNLFSVLTGATIAFLVLAAQG